MEISVIIQLFILAIFLSLNNFLASMGMGFSRIWGGKRFQVAFIFGLLDFVTPLLGLLIGKLTGSVVGDVAGYFGVFVLLAIGLFLMYSGLKKEQRKDGTRKITDTALAGVKTILFIGFWFSVDNLFVGFSLGLLDISLLGVVTIFGLVTFLMSLAGINIGKRIRKETEGRIANLEGRGRIITGMIFVGLGVWKFTELIM